MTQSSLRALRRFAVVAAWALTSITAMAQGSVDCPTGVVATTTGPVCGQVVALDGLGEVQALLGIPLSTEDLGGDVRWPRFTEVREDALSLALPVRIGPANAERCDVYDAVGYGF